MGDRSAAVVETGSCPVVAGNPDARCCTAVVALGNTVAGVLGVAAVAGTDISAELAEGQRCFLNTLMMDNHRHTVAAVVVGMQNNAAAAAVVVAAAAAAVGDMAGTVGTAGAADPLVVVGQHRCRFVDLLKKVELGTPDLQYSAVQERRAQLR